MSIASSQSGSDATQEDLTGEIPEPTHVDRLVGPGTISSQLSGNIDDRLVHQECDISEILMKHRRSRIKEKTQFERSDLLILNFVVTRKLLLTLVPVASVNAVFPPHVPVVLDPTDQDFVARFCAQASTVSFEELYDWLSQQPGTGMSLVRRAATMFLAEAGLWANVNWHAEGSGDNEGLFINILIQPLLVAAFGAFVGCASRWTRDPLCSGEATDLDAQPALSEYQLSYGSDSIVLGEFNTPVASETQMEDGYVRLVCMGKKSVDSLFAKGFPSPVVLIHGRGMVVDVYRLSLRAEAAYFLEALGTFCLVSGPYKFSQLLGLGPLVSAQLTARSTFETIKSKSQVSTNKSWMRGTFDYKGVTIPS
ncbi:hypothetical protein B0O80DRAFT_450586 [Mortierella sp. GBAus27b]|nr:hypothetical protein B0O80DRAFT_450586 [Mortierella sp. GBAus27b]